MADPAELIRNYYASIVDMVKFGDRFGGGKRVSEMEAALLAALSPAPTVPPGFKLVPVEPTLEMIEAGYSAGMWDNENLTSFAQSESACDVYAAMLAASPQPPVVEGWRDIATNPPPRDGTEIDLWTDRKERIPDAKWYTPKMGVAGWRYIGLDGFDNLGWVPVEGRPTHWMPPPTPPNGDAR